MAIANSDKPFLITQRRRAPYRGSEKQAAVDPQGPGDTLNNSIIGYSAEERTEGLRV